MHCKTKYPLEFEPEICNNNNANTPAIQYCLPIDNGCSYRKGKPVVRRGRKVMGLQLSEIKVEDRQTAEFYSAAIILRKEAL